MHIELLVVVAFIALVLLIHLRGREPYSQDTLVSTYDTYKRGIGFLWKIQAAKYVKTLSPAKQQQFQALQSKLQPDIASTGSRLRATLSGLSDADKKLVVTFFQTLNETMRKSASSLTIEEKQLISDMMTYFLKSMNVSVN